MESEREKKKEVSIYDENGKLAMTYYFVCGL